MDYHSTPIRMYKMYKTRMHKTLLFYAICHHLILSKSLKKNCFMASNLQPKEFVGFMVSVYE